MPDVLFQGDTPVLASSAAPDVILQLKHLHGTDTIGEHKKSKGEE